MAEWTKGRAAIYVDRNLEPQGIQYPVGGALFWHRAEVQELFDLWTSYLELPEQYAIVGCYFDAAMVSWLIIVESEDIPLPKRNEDIPRLYPMWELNIETGKIRTVSGSLKFKPEGK